MIAAVTMPIYVSIEIITYVFCKIEPDLEKVGEVSLIQLTILGRTTGTQGRGGLTI